MLEIKHVSKSFPGVRALDDVTVTFAQAKSTPSSAKTVQARAP